MLKTILCFLLLACSGLAAQAGERQTHRSPGEQRHAARTEDDAGPAQEAAGAIAPEHPDTDAEQAIGKPARDAHDADQARGKNLERLVHHPHAATRHQDDRQEHGCFLLETAPDVIMPSTGRRAMEIAK